MAHADALNLGVTGLVMPGRVADEYQRYLDIVSSVHIASPNSDTLSTASEIAADAQTIIGLVAMIAIRRTWKDPELRKANARFAICRFISNIALAGHAPDAPHGSAPAMTDRLLPTPDISPLEDSFAAYMPISLLHDPELFNCQDVPNAGEMWWFAGPGEAPDTYLCVSRMEAPRFVKSGVALDVTPAGVPTLRTTGKAYSNGDYLEVLAYTGAANGSIRPISE